MGKSLGYFITLIGIAAAVAGYVLWGADGIASKKLDAALGLGLILLIIGLFLAFSPSRKAA